MRYLIVLWIAISAAMAGLYAGPAHAEKRAALAVGIDVYDDLPPHEQLKKAVNDARAVAKALSELGFDATVEANVTRLAFMRAWQRFLNKLKPGDTAAVFFAGHGVVLGGLNYLLPRDVPKVDLSDEKVLAGTSIRFNDLMDDLRDKKVRVALFIVDACRDNPFRNARVRAVGGTRGLARVEPAEGSFVMYSAGAGEQALDRLPGADSNPNSVYTRALLPILASPGLSLQDIATRVREQVVEVAKTAGHKQTPAYYDQLVGKLVLKPAPQKTAPTVSAPALPAQKQEDLAALKAEVDRLKAVAAKHAAPASSRPADEAKLKATITRLEAEVKRLEVKAAPPSEAGPPVSPRQKASRQARPDPTKYSLGIWPKGSLRIGDTVSADTPYGRLTCTSRGPTERPCRFR